MDLGTPERDRAGHRGLARSGPGHRAGARRRGGAGGGGLPQRAGRRRAGGRSVPGMLEPPAVAPVRLDVSREADVVAAFDETARRLGEPTILVNNAAVCPHGPTLETSRQGFDQVLAVNLTGAFLCSRELLRRLSATGRPGRIVNVASTAAFTGSSSALQVAYDASKGGMVALTISMAREAAGLGVTVNALAPGYMLTDMMAEKLRAAPERYLGKVPLGRLAELGEVAAAAVFLVLRQASYITGTVLNVSGGLLMG